MTFNQYDEVLKVLKTPITKKSNSPTLLDYPHELRGLSNNKFGGHQTRHLRGFRGSKFGPAGPVKQYTPEERRDYERRMNDK